MKIKHHILLVFIFSSRILVSQDIEIVTQLSSAPGRLLLNGTDLYVSEVDKLSKIDLSISSPRSIDVANGLKSPSGMVLNGNDLYIALYDDNKISKLDITATSPVLTDVVTGLRGPNGMALVGNDLYFSESGANRISKIDISSSMPNPTIVATGLDFPGPIVTAGSALYVAEIIGDKISKIDLSSNSATPTTVIALTRPNGLRVKDGNLYVAQVRNGKISKVDISGSSAALSDAITGLQEPTDLVFFEESIYVAERQPQRVSKVTSLILGTVPSDIAVYPNPCRDFIHIAHERMEYTIYDSFGKVQLTGSRSRIVDVRSLASGTYILEAGDQKSIIVKQ